MRSFNPFIFRLTNNAFSRSALAIDRFIKRMSAIQSDPHETPLFDVNILHTANAFGKLLMVTGLCCGLRKEERTLITLGSIAIGMVKFLCWNHQQFFRTKRNAIGVTFKSWVSMLIEGNSGNSPVGSAHFVYVPSIKCRICSNISGKQIECTYCLLMEIAVIRHIAFSEGLGAFGYHSISITSGNS